MSATAFHPERRHTLYLCEENRAAAAAFLDTDVDMSSVQRHRISAREAPKQYSVVAYVMHAVGRVLINHPEVNAAIRGRMRPRVARYSMVSGKLTLDASLNGRRVVLSTVIPSLDDASLDTIQEQVNHFRGGDPDTMPEYARIRALHRLPTPLGRALFKLRTRSLRHRPELIGTVAITSLGHRAVDSFHFVGGTAVTVGVGRVVDRAVVRGGEVTVAPMMRLSLAVDHRVVDSAEAADVLTELKSRLETFTPDYRPPGFDAPSFGTPGHGAHGHGASGYGPGMRLRSP